MHRANTITVNEQIHYLDSYRNDISFSLVKRTHSITNLFKPNCKYIWAKQMKELRAYDARTHYYSYVRME